MFYFLVAATVLAACAAFTDWRTGHIPNVIPGLGLAGAIVAHFVRGASYDGLRGGLTQAGFAVLAAVVCALVPMFMYAKGAMGGGDVKLFAALGALLHMMGGLEAQTYAFLAAAVLAPAKLAAQGQLFRTLANTAALALNPLRPKAKRKAIPEAMVTWYRLGPAIFVGTAATLVVHAYGSAL
jgi:prepilin peptidase CpaA